MTGEKERGRAPPVWYGGKRESEKKKEHSLITGKTQDELRLIGDWCKGGGKNNVGCTMVKKLIKRVDPRRVLVAIREGRGKPRRALIGLV